MREDKHSSLKVQRFYLWMCVIVYPVWSIYLDYMIPQAYDCGWQRFAVGAISLIFLLGTYYSAFVRRRIYFFVYFAAGLVTVHYYYLVYQTSLSTVYAIGSLIVSAGITLMFSHVWAYVGYSLLVLFLASANIYLGSTPLDVAFMLVAGLLTIHLCSGAVLWRRIATAKRLTDEQEKNSELRFQMLKMELENTKKQASELKERAYHDDLTGLPNRNMFLEYFDRVYHLSKRRKSIFSVLYIDLDGFKEINDLYGHEVGDQVLQRFGSCLCKALRKSDFPARLGGDEFVALLSETTLAEDSRLVAKRILNEVSSPFNIKGHNFQVGASIGIAVFPNDATDNSALLRYADLAMYQAKKAGKNTFAEYSAILCEDNEGTPDRRRGIKKGLAG